MHHWHMRLMSLIKESKCFRHYRCKTIKFVCVVVCTCTLLCARVCVSVWEKLSQLFSLSIISPSLHNGFSPALNGWEYKLELTLNSRAFTLLTESWICGYIKQRARPLIISLTFKYCLWKGQDHNTAMLCYWSIFVLHPWAIPLASYRTHLSH